MKYIGTIVMAIQISLVAVCIAVIPFISGQCVGTSDGLIQHCIDTVVVADGWFDVPTRLVSAWAVRLTRPAILEHMPCNCESHIAVRLVVGQRAFNL
jgi:hypothetical protein